MSIDTQSIDNSYLVFIRSKEVEQISTDFNSNMKINLDASINRLNATQDIHLQLSSCEIPVSFYNFSSNLNNINLFLDGSSNLTITEQHYDIYDLITEITDASFPYSVSYDSKKAKVTLTNTDATEHTINFSENSSRGLAKALGFNREDVTVASGGSITSPDVINLNTIHSIFVHTDLPVTNVITTTNNNYRNIVQKIPVNKQFGDVINYNPYQSSLFSTIINSNHINNFSISLRDQNDILIDFNDVNFEISLLFEIHNAPIAQPEVIQSGGRRSDFGDSRRVETAPLQTQSNVGATPVQTSIPQGIGLVKVQPKIQAVLPTQLGGYSQPKPEPPVPVITENPKLEEDKTLDDKQNDKLQNALLDIALLEDII